MVQCSSLLKIESHFFETWEKLDFISNIICAIKIARREELSASHGISLQQNGIDAAQMESIVIWSRCCDRFFLLSSCWHSEYCMHFIGTLGT